MARNYKNEIDSKKGEELTLFQWLECYEFITKREFNKLPKYKQENYRTEFEMFTMDKSQYNRYES